MQELFKGEQREMASEEEKNLTEVFMVKARRCKRCGGLLTSE